MLETIYSLPFMVLEVPNLKIKQPTWLHAPSAMTMFSLVLLSYFLVTGGKQLNEHIIGSYHNQETNENLV